MATINLTIDPISGTSTQGTDKFQIFFGESVEAGDVIGVLKGFTGSDAANISTWITEGAGDDSGRFEIVKAASTGPGYNQGEWVVRIKNAGSTYFNAEDPFAPYLNSFGWTVTTGSNTYKVGIATVVENVNEAPINIVHNGGAVANGVNGATVGTLNAFDEDDDYVGSGTITYTKSW
jgi:hypothetical protein